MSSSAQSLDLITNKLWLNEGLFWAHVAIIVSGIYMGLVLPFLAVVIIVFLHRLHLLIFDGCIFSKLQSSQKGLAENENFLQNMTLRLFKVRINKKVAKVLDYAIVSLSLIVAYAAQFTGGRNVIMYLTICLFAGWGVFASMQIVQKKRSDSTSATCSIDGDCSAVQHSSFANIFGVPLEYIGAAYFCLLLAVEVLLQYLGLQPSWQPYVIMLTTLGAGSSLFFIFAQKAFLRQLCQQCMNAHGASLFLAGISLYRFLF